MAQVTEITKPFLRDAREEMTAALREFGERHGIKVTVGNASFTPGAGGNATFKVELATRTPEGEVNTKEMTAFRQHATMFGLKPEQLGIEFTLGGSRYKLVGLNPRARSMPLLGENKANGKVYKLPLYALDYLRESPVVRQ